ncbi:hypothetical protein Q2347_20635, partial [Escherichia coli]|nr:hypothetical protein [Escherichia coli]
GGKLAQSLTNFFIADTIKKKNVHRDSRILSSKVNENSSYFNCRKTLFKAKNRNMNKNNGLPKVAH